MNIAETHAAQVFLEFMAKESKWDLSSDARPLLATLWERVLGETEIKAMAR